MTLTTLSLVPAYGRDYKSKQDVLADFNADKDFIVSCMMSQWDNKPCNKSDLINAGYKRVMIWYKRLTSIVLVDL